MDNIDWTNLPEHIIVNVLSYMKLKHRVQAARVCRSWQRCFTSQQLWKQFDFRFHLRRHVHLLKCLERYGRHLRDVAIECSQEIRENRENACTLIVGIASLRERRLQKLRVAFCGENPLFYSGQEFVSSLLQLFGKPAPECQVLNSLISVDLSKLPIAFGDDLLDSLAASHSDTLQILNIQNESLVCKVTSACMLNFVRSCKHLKRLGIHYCSLSEDVIHEFMESGRDSIELLSVKCRREQKYGKDISSQTWSDVVSKLPNFRVALLFDHTCPMHKVDTILKPEIPVVELRLELHAQLVCEVNFAADHFHRTLEKLVVSTTSSPDLDEALVQLSVNCKNMKELHVYCLMQRSAIDRILEQCPGMTKSTLKDCPSPCIWPPP